jgi:hypothetical protein
LELMFVCLGLGTVSCWPTPEVDRVNIP